MRNRFEYPKDMLNKDQIFNLIFKSFSNEGTMKGDQGDMAGYAEMHFGPMIFDEGFRRYSDEEVQEWYYREYLPDRDYEIQNGYDRGQ